MKNTAHFYPGLLLLSLLLAIIPLSGQICIPSAPGTAQGIFPASLPDVCRGALYDETLSIRVPSDTTVAIGGNPLVATIDSFILDNIIGLPPGLAYTCLTPSCQIMGGAASCLRIAGIPLQAGTYPLDFYVTYYGKVGGTPLSQADTILAYYTLSVNDLTSVATVESASCGGSNGSAAINVSGTAPYRYLWNTGHSLASLPNIPAGQYIITTTDANTCQTIDTLTVPNVGKNPQIVRNKVGWQGCTEDGMGIIDLSIQDGQAGNTYTWAHGPMTLDLNQVAAGRYTLTVQDVDNCRTTEDFTISVPPVLDLSILIQTNVLCAGDNTGSVSTLISGGIAPYITHWNTNPPVFSSLLNELEAGIYTLSVSDSLSCQKTLDVHISEPEPLVSDILTDGETYEGAKDASATASISGGTPPYTYQWNTGGTSPQLDNLENGTYVLTTTDASGCTREDSVFVGKWATGIAEELRAGFHSLSIFPNPSTGVFTIETEISQGSELDIRIFDLSGKLVWKDTMHTNIQFRYTLDLAKQKAGLYIISLETSQGIVYRKLWMR